MEFLYVWVCIRGSSFSQNGLNRNGKALKMEKKKKGCILLPSKKSVDLALSQVKSVIYSKSIGKLALPKIV